MFSAVPSACGKIKYRLLRAHLRIHCIHILFYNSTISVQAAWSTSFLAFLLRILFFSFLMFFLSLLLCFFVFFIVLFISWISNLYKNLECDVKIKWNVETFRNKLSLCREALFLYSVARILRLLFELRFIFYDSYIIMSKNVNKLKFKMESILF